MLLVVLASVLCVACTLASPVRLNDTETFVAAASYEYMLLNFVSGCTIDNILNWDCRYCQDESFTVVNAVNDPVTEAQFYVGYVNNIVVVSFRGSQELENWVADFQYAQVDYPPVPNAKVHKGFYNTWTSIKSSVFSNINTALVQCGSQCVSVGVVGHSLGGALSTLAALEYATEYSDISVFSRTTGSPRVGNSVFASHYNTVVPDTQRMVSNDDEVPHLPPKLFGFSHVATEIWGRTAAGQITYTVCNGGEDPTCSDSVPFGQWDISDHLFYMGLAKAEC